MSHLGSRAQPRIAENYQGATRHTSCEEAVAATFILVNVKAAASGGQATPSKATVKGARKGTKGSKKGRSNILSALPSWPAMTAMMRKPTTPMRSMSWLLNMISCAR
jgi:hypothetical protein